MKERELKIREAYRGDSNKKKCWYTGHTGFKGTWLLGMLQELDCDVIGYALIQNHKICIITFQVFIQRRYTSRCKK